MNLRDAFLKLQAQFNHESHQYPALRHFWLQAISFVHIPVLETVAKIFDQPLAEVTQWPCENSRIEFSCFVGGKEQVECFGLLAEHGRQLFVQLCQRLSQPPRHTLYPPHISWLADVYYQANMDPKQHISIEYFALGEWATAKGATRFLKWPLGEQSEAHLQSLRTKLGEPIAVHRVQILVQDVFTASVAMITKILKEDSTDSRVGTALDASVRESALLTPPGGGPLPSTATATTSDSGATKPRSPAPAPTRPSWVNQAELIGPIGHLSFAKLMKISDKHLYRMIQKELVWKERGPSAKKFYFYHSDPSIHRRLREAFERDKSKTR